MREAAEGKPVEIGRLQRFATDTLMAKGVHPFTRAAPTGKRVAVVGAGPAGLACAHRLAMKGHDVVIYERRPKAGRAERIRHRQLQDRRRFRRGRGGLAAADRRHHGEEPGSNWGAMSRWPPCGPSYDAVFLGIGLGGVNALRAAGEDLPGVRNAVDFIAELRQADD